MPPNMLPDEQLDTDVLDCWEANLAIVLRQLARNDIRTVFGSEWWADFDEGQVERGLSLWSRPLEERLAALAGVCLIPIAMRGNSLVETCAAVLAQGLTPLVVSDAYCMPWVPYYGQIHISHSFVVAEASTSSATLAFVDAYENSTEWGEARPQAGVAGGHVVRCLQELEPGPAVYVLEPADALPSIDRAELLRSNVAAMPRWLQDDPIGRLARCYAAAAGDLDRFSAFCLDCWEILRKRRLYQRWLEDLEKDDGGLLPPGFRKAFEADVIAPWVEANRFAYVNLRRLRLAREPSSQVFELVAQAGVAERELARELVDWVERAPRHRPAGAMK